MNLESRHIRMVMGLRRAGVADARVLAAMERVDRAEYVAAAWREHAYDNRPLPIGHGQTISQPAVVGLMLQALDVSERMRVLEIGVGSGYQTALLARLSRAVYGVERIKALLNAATPRLPRDNVFLRWGDGGAGWPEAAPFDRIVAAAAAEDVPAALADQLKVGGVMVLPLGAADGGQDLLKVNRTETGFTHEKICSVAFVPFLNGAVDTAPDRAFAGSGQIGEAAG